MRRRFVIARLATEATDLLALSCRHCYGGIESAEQHVVDDPAPDDRLIRRRAQATLAVDRRSNDRSGLVLVPAAERAVAFLAQGQEHARDLVALIDA
jgi:hypothetical protein